MAKKQPLKVRIVRVPSADAPHAQREAAKLLGQQFGELFVGDVVAEAQVQAEQGM